MLEVIWDIDRKSNILKGPGTSHCIGIFSCRGSSLGMYHAPGTDGDDLKGNGELGFFGS
jgi:hypothetical protein